MGQAKNCKSFRISLLIRKSDWKERTRELKPKRPIFINRSSRAINTNMDRKEVDELRKEASAAFKKKDFERTFFLSEKLAEENVPAALFRCGLILEKGWLNGKKDLDRALEFYRRLA